MMLVKLYHYQMGFFSITAKQVKGINCHTDKNHIYESQENIN